MGWKCYRERTEQISHFLLTSGAKQEFSLLSTAFFILKVQDFSTNSMLFLLAFAYKEIYPTNLSGRYFLNPCHGKKEPGSCNRAS